jgi:hypothetical protein
MTPTGDHYDRKQKAARTLESTRLVALCNSSEGYFLWESFFLDFELSNQADNLMAPR